MNSKRLSVEKILILFGVLIFGVIVVYNAYFIPDVPSDASHSGTILFKKDVEKPESRNIVDGKINLNTATREELIDYLPGVGEKIADRIISYREAHNGFKNVEEIMKIKGIGEKFFDNIKDFLAV